MSPARTCEKNAATKEKMTVQWGVEIARPFPLAIIRTAMRGEL
jgi:hypothetical protein